MTARSSWPRELYASRRYTTAEIARRLKVGRSTLYRYLGPEGDQA
jgi:hypothetical protein